MPNPSRALRNTRALSGAVALALLGAGVLAPQAAIAGPGSVAGPTTITATGGFTGTVPANVCSVTATVIGASGGNAIGRVGANGAGAAITATYPVTSGTSFNGAVGAGGGISGVNSKTGGAAGASTGTNAAGAGGASTGTVAPYNTGAGGGGYSDLFFAGQRVIFAGGGGGTGGGAIGAGTNAQGFGGNAGLPSTTVPAGGSSKQPGADGAAGLDGTNIITGGKGGTDGAGGAAGTNSGSAARNGAAGGMFNGGNGGSDTGRGTGGGGGGGRYNGGGGAATVSDDNTLTATIGAGGGGGPSYVQAVTVNSKVLQPAAVSAGYNTKTTTAGAAAGANGSVKLTWNGCAYDLSVDTSVSSTSPTYGDELTWKVVATNGSVAMGPDDTATVSTSAAVGGTVSKLQVLDQDGVAVEGVTFGGLKVGDAVPSSVTANRALLAGEKFVLEYTSEATDTVSAEWTVSDRGAATNDKDSASTTVTITTVTADDDAFDAKSNEPLVLSKGDFTNDDTGTGPLAFEGVDSTSTEGGTVEVNEAGNVVYTPKKDFIGTDTFKYTVMGPTNDTTTENVDYGTVTVTVKQVLPIAGDDEELSATDLEDTEISLTDLLANDSGTGPLSITAVKATEETKGSVKIVDGNVVYTPASDFTSSDTFEYTLTGPNDKTDTATVTVSVDPVNAEAEDDAFELSADGVKTFTAATLLGNDTGTGPLELEITSQPEHGSLKLVEGTYTYTPNAGYFGDDSFDYEVAGHTESVDSATVKLTVKVVAPVAADVPVSVTTGGTVTVDVLAKATGTKPMTVNIKKPAHGTAIVDDEGKIVYTADSDYSGSDSIEFELAGPSGAKSYGEVDITVKPIVGSSDASAASGELIVIDPAADASGSGITLKSVDGALHGTATLENGKISYRSVAGYSGPETISYTLVDANGQETEGTIEMMVTPVAVEDKPVVVSGQSVEIALLSNDSGTALKVVGHTDPSHGELTVDENGEAKYTAAAGFVGTDSFTYTVEDEFGQTVTATVTVTVAAEAISAALASTGADAAGIGFIAAMLLVAGAGVFALGRRRKASAQR